MPQQDYASRRLELDADAMIRLAQEKAALSDFGGDGFHEPLCQLLEAAARDVEFHPDGLTAFKNDINRILINRLRMAADMKKHPEILQEDVSDPIVVIGFGRSGTTKLHKMLSAPNSVQKTLFWRLWNPAPFPGSVSGRQDPRLAAAGTAHMLTEDNPIYDAAHHVEEGDVEEEWMVYQFTFEDWVWAQILYMPSYFDWVMPRPSIHAYRYVKTVLQYLQWQDGGKRGRPWVLKALGHMAHLDSLLECYPNAVLVHPHRDPRATIPSYAKLCVGVGTVFAAVDPHARGREVVRQWTIAADRYLEARDRLKLDDRILDVEYEQVRTDPMPVMREIYRRAGRKLSPEADQAMAMWHDTNEQGRYGKHEYSLAEFGLSEERVDAAFAQYIGRFIDR
jgi:Sulfotransferase family